MTTMESLLLAWLDGDVAAGHAMSDLLEEQGQSVAASTLRGILDRATNAQAEQMRRIHQEMEKIRQLRELAMTVEESRSIKWSGNSLSLWDI